MNNKGNAMHNVKTWIVSSLALDFGSFNCLTGYNLEVKVFTDKELAFKYACELAERDITGNIYKDKDIEEFNDYFLKGDYIAALGRYNEFMHVEEMPVLEIRVYNQLIDIGNSLDCSCRQCSRKVSSGDSECWWCGIHNPLEED